MQNDQGILLETGTNEFEIIEFSVGNVCYGINVAKVRETINPIPVTPIVNMHPYVDGIFTLREKVMPLVNLARCLSSKEATGSHKVVVCEINNVFIGFKADNVSRIYRISWTQMEPAPSIARSDLVVGIIKMDNRLIILLDFEKILSEINPEMNKRMTSLPNAMPDLIELRKSKTILIAEDSLMLRELLLNTLHTAGYNVIAKETGQQAWDELIELTSTGKPIDEHIQLVITDIEMPQMDGHHLTKKIKEDKKLKDLPIVIFSSLINPEMRRKGEALGAYAQITKPEIKQLIDIVDQKIAYN